MKSRTGIFFTSIFMHAALAAGQPVAIPPTELQVAISDHTADYDFILLDVRDFLEVDLGIIASDCCKPYHLSIRFNELEQQYGLLPKDTAIIIYCANGNRSIDAGNFLIGKGFTSVGSVVGGISAYRGTLRDSTEFKSLVKLPEPSYFKEGCVAVRTTVPYRTPQSVFSSGENEVVRYFTLQGRLVPIHNQRATAPALTIGTKGRQSFGALYELLRPASSR